MVKTDIWMPLYIGDYLADTSRLTTEQHGAYLLLLMDYWRSGRLPNDDKVLAQISKLTDDAWSNARAMLVQFFSIEDGFWIHKRVEQEMTEAKVNKQKNHDRAVKAAKVRWDNATSNAMSNTPSNAKVMLEECPSPLPSKKNNIHMPEGVTQSVWDDYLKIRKAAKKPITETALKGLVREANKAGKTLNEALVICCEKSWLGFEASWLKGDVKQVSTFDEMMRMAK
jgi:uncharacterized protein YdaU (DUF1376 family)